MSLSLVSGIVSFMTAASRSESLSGIKPVVSVPSTTFIGLGACGGVATSIILVARRRLVK